MNFEKLCETLREQGAKPRAYSGRAMYGRHCVGVYMKHMGEYSLPKGFSLDNLGMGVIAYWPRVTWKTDQTVEQGK